MSFIREHVFSAVVAMFAVMLLAAAAHRLSAPLPSAGLTSPPVLVEASMASPSQTFAALPARRSHRKQAVRLRPARHEALQRLPWSMSRHRPGAPPTPHTIVSIRTPTVPRVLSTFKPVRGPVAAIPSAAVHEARRRPMDARIIAFAPLKRRAHVARRRRRALGAIEPPLNYHAQPPLLTVEFDAASSEVPATLPTLAQPKRRRR